MKRLGWVLTLSCAAVAAWLIHDLSPRQGRDPLDEWRAMRDRSREWFV